MAWRIGISSVPYVARLRLAGTVAIIVTLLWAGPAEALPGSVFPSPPGPAAYEVRPGDTLARIADRYGVTVRALMRLNSVQDPRQIYVGQTLLLGTEAMPESVASALVPGIDLLELSRASGMDPEPVARANGLLGMTGLPEGLRVMVPSAPGVVAVSTDPVVAPVPRVAAAIRYGAHLWDVLRLNPLPGTMGQQLVLPAAGVEAAFAGPQGRGLPFPVSALEVSPQPVARGEVAVISVATAEPVVCALTYLSRTEGCIDVDGSGLRWIGLVGLPALLQVGVTPVSLQIRPHDGGEVEVVVPLLVEAGRYDYERLDLPADRQSLLDPTASQAEAAKIAYAAVATLSDTVLDVPLQTTRTVRGDLILRLAPLLWLRLWQLPCGHGLRRRGWNAGDCALPGRGRVGRAAGRSRQRDTD